MNLKRVVRVAVFSLAVVASGAAWADSSIEQELVATETAYGALNYEEAGRRAETLTRRRGLTHDQMVRTYRVLALSRAAIGEDDKARDAFVLLLTVDPEHKVDRSLGPKVQQPFLEARGFWRNQLQKPGIEASLSTLRPGTSATLRIVTRDPTHVAKTVSVGWRYGTSGPYETSNVSIGEQTVLLGPAPARESRLDYYVQALDANDSVVFELASPQAPRTAFVEVAQRLSGDGPGPAARRESSSIFSSPLFWMATVVVVGGGAAGGYFLTTRESEQRSLPPTSANVGPILVCGAERCR